MPIYCEQRVHKLLTRVSRSQFVRTAWYISEIVSEGGVKTPFLLVLSGSLTPRVLKTG
jgi:hypothetical protein